MLLPKHKNCICLPIHFLMILSQEKQFILHETLVMSAKQNFPPNRYSLWESDLKKKVFIDPRTTFFTFPAIVPTSVWQLHLNNSTFKEWETMTIAHISHNPPWSPFFEPVYFLALRMQNFGPFGPIEAILSHFLHAFTNMAVYQNGQIWGMASYILLPIWHCF